MGGGGEDDVAVVGRAVDAFNEVGADIDNEELEMPDGIFAEEIEIVPFRAALENVTFSGPTAIDDFWDASRESWSELRIEIGHIEPSGSGVLALGILTGTSRETGAHVESEIAFACKLRDALIVRLATHLSADAARAELSGE